MMILKVESLAYKTGNGEIGIMMMMMMMMIGTITILKVKGYAAYLSSRRPNLWYRE